MLLKPLWARALCALAALFLVISSGAARAELVGVTLSSGGGAPATETPATQPKALYQTAPDADEVDPKDTLAISASVSPSGMAVPQEAQVYLTLVNSAENPISDIQVLSADGKLLQDVGTLSDFGQSSQVFTQSVTPTYKQLRAGGIQYVIRYTLGKGTEKQLSREMKVLAPVTKLKAEPSLDFTRSLSANYAQQGEEISITYRVRNTGNVTLTDIVIKDPLCGEVARIESLAPGKKETIAASVVIEQTVDSKPQVSYSYANAEKPVKKTLDPLTIYQADGRLEATLEADKSAVSPDEVVTLRLVLTNKGQVTYDKLEISDQGMGALGSAATELKPGDQQVFTKRVPLKATTTFLFSVNGLSTGGSPVSATSNMLTVAVTPVIDSIKLTLTAEADRDTMPAPGTINFTITIHNEGELDIRNVVLSELSEGAIKTLAVVPPGGTTIEQSYQVNQSGSYTFLAELTDADQRHMIVRSNTVDIKIQPSGGPTPEQAAPEVTTGLGLTGDDTSYHIEQRTSMFSRMLLGVLVVLGTLVLAFVIGGVMGLRKKRKLRAQQLRKLKRGRLSARRMEAQAQSEDIRPPSEPRGDTGVYKITKNNQDKGNKR